MSFGSRNSSDRDQNETHTCETIKSPTSKKVPKSKIKTKSSFNSYYDSGIVPDSSEYTGTIRSQQAGVVNNAFELDTTPAAASVTGHISGDGRFKTRPGLNRKRISFKDEVEAKQMAGVPLEEGLVAESVLGLFDISNPQQHDTLYMSSIAADPPINQNEINGAENGLSIEHQPTSKSASCLGIGSSNGKRRRKYGYSGGDQSLFEVPDEPSSLGRPPGNNDSPPASNSDRTGKEIEAKTMYGVKTPSENSVSYLVFNDKQTTVDNSQKAFISSKSESDHIEGEKSLTEEKEQHQMISQRDRCGGSNQENSTFKTVQITHFPIGRNSDIMTTTLNSKSPHTSTPFSLRSTSFVERTQKRSLGEQKARSRSFANDSRVSEANSTKGMGSIPKDTTQARREQHPIHPTTTKRAYDAGASLDARRFRTYGAPLSELLPNLSKTKSFESILSNTLCKADNTTYEGRDLPPFQRHSSSFKEGELQGPYKWSYSEPDLTYTLPATTFLASPCPAGEQRGTVTCTYGPHNERYKENVNNSYLQRRASSPQVMPLSPNKIYRQLSELSQKDLEREVFC